MYFGYYILYFKACRKNEESENLGMDKGIVVNVKGEKMGDLDTKFSPEISMEGQPLVHYVTDVECPEDTLLMFASLSGKFNNQ